MTISSAIPQGWANTEIIEVCNIYAGAGFPNEYQGKLSGKYPFYKVSDISNCVQKGNVYLTFSNNYIDERELLLLKAKTIPENTVVFAKIGEALKLNRRAITNSECLVDNNAIGIKAKPNIICDKWLFYFLNTVKLEKYSRATTVPSVRKTDIEKIQVLLPPLPEQHRIVGKIEELFSELDKGVENLKLAQQQLKVYRQAVLKAAFEQGGLQGTEFSEWVWKPLGEFAEKIRIGPFGSLLHESDYIHGGVPVINPKHIRDQKIVPNLSVTISLEKKQELSAYLLEENDILLGRRGEMGRTAYVTNIETGWVCGTGSMFIRLRKNNVAKLYSIFLSAEKTKKYLEAHCTGTTMKNLNDKIVSNISVPLIPFAEQISIVAEIESRLSVCDKLEETIKSSLIQAESLRQSILKKAFAGELMQQDPNDEPAEKLLARIRVERTAQAPVKKTATGRTKKHG
ncbi:MAG: restriction endonuclease subunit S [Bacillota bacterium]